MWLDERTFQALNGLLCSPPASSLIYSGASSGAVTVKNSLPLAVTIVPLDVSGGHSQPVVTVAADATEVLHYWFSDGYAIVLSTATGGFVGCLGPLPGDTAGLSLSLNADLLLRPNAIGPAPAPTEGSMIPPDSPRVVVGCGQSPNGATILREQYWQRLPESTTLPPNESLTRATTLLSGMSDTSSSQQELERSLGLSASGGWGPFSASVSSSLSLSSSSFQQVTATTQSTIFNSSTYNNTGQDSAYLLLWQLTEVVTVLDASGRPKAAYVTAIPPAIVARYELPVTGAAFVVPSGLAPGSYRVTARSGSLAATADLVVPGGATLSLVPSSGSAGTEVAVAGSGFTAGQAVTIEIEVSPGSGQLGPATISPVGLVAGPDGTIPVGTTLTLPSEPGDYALSASAGTSDCYASCTVKTPTLVLTPDAATAGMTVAVSGTGFLPDATAEVTIGEGSSEMTLGSLEIDSAGNLTDVEA
jgi:hypothetical protein